MPKAALHVKIRGFFGHPLRGGLSRKLAFERQGNLFENSDAAFGTTSEVVIVFIETSKMFIFIFLFNRQHKKLKTNGACTESTDLFLQAFQQIISP